MPIITESLIRKMKEDVAAAIAADGTVEFGGDATLQAIFDLALEALNAPDDTAALADIRRERTRQIEELKRLPEDDDQYTDGQMADAAAAYALVRTSGLAFAGDVWPWGAGDFKDSGERRNLVKAGALIVAEVERLDRAEARATNPQD
jgi:hypothetical protein